MSAIKVNADKSYQNISPWGILLFAVTNKLIISLVIIIKMIRVYVGWLHSSNFYSSHITIYIRLICTGYINLQFVICARSEKVDTGIRMHYLGFRRGGGGGYFLCSVE